MTNVFVSMIRQMSLLLQFARNAVLVRRHAPEKQLHYN